MPEKQTQNASISYDVGVGTPRFRPVEAFSSPRQFGRVVDAAAGERGGMTQTQVAWAMFQHRAACAVREELAARGMSIGELAAEVCEGESWLRRKLHGQVPADLGDVLGWALVLGVHVLPVIDDLRELSA